MTREEFDDAFYSDLSADDGCSDPDCEGCRADADRVWEWLQERMG